MALGDTIESFTTITGIKTLVDGFSEITNLDCGCGERKELLNNPNLLINKIFYKDGVSNEGGSLQHEAHPDL
jgi:hypothetical protein